MPNEQVIRKKMKRFRAVEKVCTQFQDMWTNDSSFTGHFSKFASAVLKLELIAFTGSTTLSPAMEGTKRRVVINPLQLDANMELLISEIEEHIGHMENWCKKQCDIDFCKSLQKIRR